MFLSILPNNSHIGCLSLKAKFNTSSLLSVTLGSSPKVLVLVEVLKYFQNFNTHIKKKESAFFSNISKGSLDSVPSSSPSLKIQIIGKKVCLRCKGQKLLDVVNKLLKTMQYFAFTPQANYLAYNLNFHWGWRWWDWIQATF